KLERMRDQYLAIKANSKDNDSNRAGSIVESLQGAMRADFGAGGLEYSRAEDVGALATAMQNATAKLTTYGDKDELLRYIGIAHGAGLVQLEEQLLTRIKDYAFAARQKPEDARCYEELRTLLAFYNRRAQFARAAEMLTAQMAADKYSSRFDYQNQIAAEYQLTGDKTKELAALGAAYAAVSGELIG